MTRLIVLCLITMGFIGDVVTDNHGRASVCMLGAIALLVYDATERPRS